MTNTFSESRRQLVHMAMAGFALFLPFIHWWEAAALAALAIAFNLFALPHIGGARLFRPAEASRRHYSGIALYPASILVLICLLPHRPDIVAAAWGILAFGDGCATVVGRAAGGPRIPWNPEKSVAGSVALMVCGGAAGVALSWWCRPPVIPPPYPWFSTAAPLVAAVVAAAVETIPIRLDDNVSVPAVSAAVMWAISLASPAASLSAAHAAAAMLPVAVLANAAVAMSGYAARTVSRSGAIAGAFIGITILTATGWSGWALLLSTFAAAVVASRMGLRRKTLLGIAEGRGGRRGAGNAIANTGVAAVAAVLVVVTYAPEPALIGMAAALVAGSSDTIASEIGKAWGRRAYLVPTFRHVPPGTSGAVSLEGTAAGLVGAVGLGALAVALRLIPADALVAVVLGATIGSVVESALGATLEAPGVVNNDVLNLLNTTVAAGAAVLLANVLP